MATTKVFKTGNSVAVRLPKSFGAVPGTAVRVREEQGRWVVEPVLEGLRNTIDLTGIAGSCPGLRPLPLEERGFEDRELGWGDMASKRG